MEDERKACKLDEEYRTFETRLKFIGEVFANKFSQETIMTNCIQHKLKRSYESYVEDINRSIKTLTAQDPLAILKKINSD